MWVWLIGWVGRIRPHSERPSTRSISQRAPRKTALLHVGAAPPALGRRWIIPGHLAAAKSRKAWLQKTKSARQLISRLITRESQTNLHIPDGSQKSHDVNALIAVSQKKFLRYLRQRTKVNKFSKFLTVKFRQHPWKKLELKLPPPLKPVAALPCEKLAFNYTAVHYFY